MKRVSKFIVSLATSLTLVCLGAVSSSATEVINNARWCHMSYNSSSNPRCDLSASTSYLWSRWSTYSTNAFTNWNNNSDNRVNISETAFSTSNVDLFTYGSSNLYEWPWDINVAGFTSLVDKSGHVYSGGMRSDDDPLSSFGNRINYAGVIFNPFPALNNTDITNDQILKHLVHELGHCINLGHETGLSIMKQGWVQGGTNYTSPTLLDRYNISQMYNAIYS